MRNWITETRDALKRGHKFASRDIWHVGSKGEPLPEGFIIKQIRAIILLARSLADEKFMLRASALTFATMVFIVPFLILMFGFINTFNLGDKVYDTINERMNSFLTSVAKDAIESEESDTDKNINKDIKPDPASTTSDSTLNADPEILPKDSDSDNDPDPIDPLAEDPPDELTDEEKIAKSKDVLSNLLKTALPVLEMSGKNSDSHPINDLVNIVAEGALDPRALLIMGVLFLLSTVFGFMRNVESAFNSIWGVKRSRSMFHTISGYLMITLLLPFAATALIGITAALKSPYINNLPLLYSFAILAGQFLLVSLTFTALYFFVPNTRVMFRYALTGGLVAGALWILTANAYIKFQFGEDNYLSFYSTMSFIPLSLMWIYISWLILLFGTLVSFAYQNEKTFAMEYLSDNPSYAYREALAVRIAIETVRRFNNGLPPLSVTQIAESWNVPIRLLNETFEHLAEHGLMIMCATEPVTYQPARSPENTTLKDVLTALRIEGMDPSFLLEEERFLALYGALEAGGKELRDRSLTEIAALYDPLTTDEEEDATQEDADPFEEAVQP